MTLASFVDRIVARLCRTPVDLALLPSAGIAGSLFSGAAGVAFFLHEAARLRGEDELFERARAWSSAARRWADRASNDDWRGSAHGFVIGASGLAFVEALLSAHEADARGVQRALERIERASASSAGFDPDLRPTELYGGSAGLVCATLGLEQRLGGSMSQSARAVLRRIRGRTTGALEEAYAAGSDRAAPDLLGMAHGFAGELWALVTVLGPAHGVVRARLAELEALHETDRNGLVFWRTRRIASDTSMLGSFCNGMAGQSLLWSELARRTGSKRSLKLASQAAESAAVLVSKNPTLCCGLAGQSVVLQRYADVSGDARFTRRAHACISRATRAVDGMTSRKPSLGLWQGALGVALVAMSRLARERAFPCIEPPLNDAARRTSKR